MRSTIVATAAAFVFVQLVVSIADGAGTGIRKERVQFAKGATTTVIKGQLKGDAIVDYLVRAGTGQTLAVTLKKTNPQNFFNVSSPDTDVAMYVGQSGNDFTGMLPTDGDYTVRVYLMRAAARRNESSDYTLTIAVTGRALAPIPASRDALIPGTSFHASAKITCVPFLESKPRECEAFVIRRGGDGTATVEVPQATAGKRRILFVEGRPVASDATDPLTVTRQGDLSVVTLGTDERYEIPDALVTGG